jgi:N-carbamoylputrescine amidase
MIRSVTLAANRTVCSRDIDVNVAAAERLVHRATGQGAQFVLLQELFEISYFRQDRKQDFFAFAAPSAVHPVLRRMNALETEPRVVPPYVPPTGFFEPTS